MSGSLRRLPLARLLLTARPSLHSLSLRGFSTAVSEKTKDLPAKKVNTLYDRAQSLENAPVSKIRMPKAFARYAGVLKLKFGRNPVDPSLTLLLDVASSQLYFNCADGYEYERLCEIFGLPDYFSTWYKLTLMHTWMLLLRMQRSLEADAFLRLQRGILTALWVDVDKRLEIIGDEHNQVLNSAKDVGKMQALLLQSLVEYDEGFLGDDTRLAGALWRNLYLERDVDPAHLVNVIKYIRSTVAWLDTLDSMDVLTDGVMEWKQLSP